MPKTMLRMIGLLALTLVTPAAAYQPPMILEAFGEGVGFLGAPGWLTDHYSDAAHAEAWLAADLTRAAFDDTAESNAMVEPVSAAPQPKPVAIDPEQITKTTTVSIGKASRGYLINGARLLSSDTLQSRPKRNYGTPEMVTAIEEAVTAVHKKFPKTHKLGVGDLSRKGGGSFRPHVSHQSGRDADLGYYIKNGNDQSGLRRVSRNTIDAGRSFTLIQSWLEADAVEYVFVDYRLQKPMYLYARDVAKVPASKLDKWFQYPRGRRARTGIVRHLRGHADHMHVRYFAPRSQAAAKAYIAKFGTGVLKPLPVYRKVRRGDSLWKIARRYKVDLKKMRRWNRMRRRSLLKPGQKLIVGWKRPKLPSL
jgi:murein endopeptidase